MNSLTHHVSTHPDLYDLESGHFVLNVDPPETLTDFYESQWQRGVTVPQNITREVHNRLREESFSKYAELWSNLANM